jgi:glycosyltransferase involved in cell wall biosynthesis
MFIKYSGNSCVEIISSPTDMRPVYNKAWIVVVPLRSGSGTRLKVLEAMAMEKPVVSTDIGAEGIMVSDGRQLFIAADEKDFAEKINLLMCDRLIASSMVKLAKEIVVQKYNWDSIREEVSDVMREYNFL